jgi:hypothetical protein
MFMTMYVSLLRQSASITANTYSNLTSRTVGESETEPSVTQFLAIVFSASTEDSEEVQLLLTDRVPHWCKGSAVQDIRTLVSGMLVLSVYW